MDLASTGCPDDDALFTLGYAGPTDGPTGGHLDLCRPCRERVESIRRFRAYAERMERAGGGVAPPSDRLTMALEREIRQRARGHHARGRSWVARHRGWAIAASVLVVGAAAVGGVALYRGREMI